MLDLLKRIALILVSPIIAVALTIGVLVSMVLALPCAFEMHDFEDDEFAHKRVCKWCGRTEYYDFKMPKETKNND